MSYPVHCVGRLEGHEGAVMSVRFNGKSCLIDLNYLTLFKADGNYCLTGGQDRLIKLWNPHTQLLIKTYKGHGLDVNDAVAYALLYVTSPPYRCSTTDNSRLASCSSDKTILVWDIATGRVITKYRGHAAAVYSVKFNADCTVLASSSYDATVQMWDLRSNAFEPIQVHIICHRFSSCSLP